MKTRMYVLLAWVFSFPAFAQQGVEAWNLGFGLGVEQYREPYIELASIRGDDRIVVVEKTYETRPSAWLTMNWNFIDAGVKIKKRDASGNLEKDADGNQIVLRSIKWGLFAGVKLIGSNAEAFDAFSLGPQVTFATSKREISLGAGWVTHRTRKLANDISEGAALPDYYDDVQYNEGTENSYMMMLAVSIL